MNVIKFAFALFMNTYKIAYLKIGMTRKRFIKSIKECVFN